MISCTQHWDSVFSETESSELGWYENDASKTMKLMKHIPNWKTSTIFIPGAGTSILIDELLSNGAGLVLNDISLEALNKNKFKHQGENIHWLWQDISKPIINKLPKIDIWIDRAVLHFLIEDAAVSGYFDNLNATLKVGGYVLFAEFSKLCAYKCAGLPTRQYDVREFSNHLGSNYNITSYFKHTYTSPSGENRPYIYALYQRLK